MKYTRDYIVDEASAAPILDDTERSGIAADHRGMCKFESKDAPGFRTVVAALRRYVLDAPGVIRGRMLRAEEMLRNQEWANATELVRGLPDSNSRRGAGGFGDSLSGRESRYQLENSADGKRSLGEPLRDAFETVTR